MAHFETFNPFVDCPPRLPFKRLVDVAGRAMRAVKGLSLDELRTCAQRIADVVEEQKSEYVDVETELYVERLVAQGGWELSYAPRDMPITTSNVHHLLHDWPEDANESPDLPSQGDWSDLYALQDAIDHDHPTFWDDPGPLKSAATAFAVLALMNVEKALLTVGYTKGNRWLKVDATTVESLAAGADIAMDALEALCASEHRQSLESERRIILKGNDALIRAEEQRWKSERAASTVKRLLDGRHEASRRRRELAMAWYDANRNALDENGAPQYKSDDSIAEDMSGTALIGEFVPEKFRTVRDWITAHVKAKRRAVAK
jgi:hypothetical protein